jgi:hypothetical protein
MVCLNNEDCKLRCACCALNVPISSAFGCARATSPRPDARATTSSQAAPAASGRSAAPAASGAHPTRRPPVPAAGHHDQGEFVRLYLTNSP